MKKLSISLLLIFQVILVLGQSNVALDMADEIFDTASNETGFRNAIVIYKTNQHLLTPRQINKLGMCFWKIEEYKSALKYFELSALKGDTSGMFNAGYNYYYGNGTPIDYQQAYNYFSKLVLVNSNYSSIADILHMQAHCFENGASFDGVLSSPDYLNAFTYFTAAANKGHAESMLHLGDYYNNGEKITKDVSKAKWWYQKACENNNNKACEKLKQATLNTIHH